MTISSQQLSDFYQYACELELQAFKPGNVSVYADGHDMTVADFRLSAKVSAAPLCNSDYTLGERIFYAVKATREAVHCNTNLGIILLCAPVVLAAQQCKSPYTLKHSISQVLASTTVNDADWVFKAIALASPGGLGITEEQDVHQNATITLTEAMCLASDKDRIAYQYSSDYENIFDFSLPIYYNGCVRWGDQACWAVVAVYVRFLSQFPDSHIERKYGGCYSKRVAEKMVALDRELSAATDPECVKPFLYQLDQELKRDGLNPGTTADITVATVLTALIELFLKNLKKPSEGISENVY